ncbi:MAG: hypothetical protein ABW127_09840 [Candidatus Thiodiazotropha endolucinida]
MNSTPDDDNPEDEEFTQAHTELGDGVELGDDFEEDYELNKNHTIEDADDSNTVVDYAKDISQQIVSGAIDSGVGAADAINEITGLQELEYKEIQEQDSFLDTIGYLFIGVPRKLRDKIEETIPDAKTTPGHIAHDIAQFVSGFIGAGKLLAPVTSLQKYHKSKALIAGAAADTTFDPDEDTLAELLNKHPLLDKYVPDVLVSSEDDSRSVKRLKNALEGAGLGVLADSFIVSLRAMRNKYDGSIDYSKLTEDINNAIDSSSHIKPNTPTDSGQSWKPISDEEKNRIAEKIKKNEFTVESDNISINYDQMFDDDSIKSTFNEIADLYTKSGNKSFTEKRTYEETRRLADLLSEDSVKLSATLPDLYSGVDNLDVQVAATFSVLKSTSERVSLLARQLNANPTNLELRANFINQIEILGNMTRMAKGIQTNIARGLSSYKHFSKHPIPAIDNAEVSGQLDDIATDSNIDKLAETIIAAEDNTQAILKISGDGYQSTLNRLLHGHNEYFINALLSHPKTHMVNMTSNFLQANVMGMERLAGAALQFDGEGISQHGYHMYYLYRHAHESLRAAKASFLKKDNILDSGHRVLDTDMQGRHVIPGMAGEVIRTPTRFLQAEDEFFKQAGYRAAWGAKLARDALSRGLNAKQVAVYVENNFQKGFDATGRGIDEESLEFARISTFTNDLGSFGQWVQNGANTYPLLRVVLPFVRTPTNIIKQWAQRSIILTPLQKQFRDDYAAGGARRQQAIGKLVTGSSLYVLASQLAMPTEEYDEESGAHYLSMRLTGGGPNDHVLRSRMYEMGWRPYSIRNTNSKGEVEYIEYSRYDPLAIFLGIVADTVEISEVLPRTDQDTIAGQLLAAVSKNITSKTYLQGLSNVIEIVQGSEPHKIQRILHQQAASEVPNILKIANTDEHFRDVRSTLDAIRNRLPGFSSDLPAKRNIFGEKTLKPESFYGGIFPSTHSMLSNSVAKRELGRLSYMTGQRFLPIPTVYNGVNLLDHNNHDSSMNAYDAWNDAIAMPLNGTGDTLLQAITKVINNSSYSSLNDEQRADSIKEVIAKHRASARATMLADYPAIREAARKNRLLEKQGGLQL